MQDDKYTARHTNVSKVSSGCQSHVILMGSIETMLINYFQLLETADADACKASSNQVKQHVNHVAVCSCLKAFELGMLLLRPVVLPEAGQMLCV